MAIAWRLSWTPWSGTQPATSASQTTVAGDCIIGYGLDQTNAPVTLSMSSSVDGALTLQVEGVTPNFDELGVFAKANITGGSQTLSLSYSGTTDTLYGWGYEYSGVASVGSAVLSGRTNPGTGAGAILGAAVTLPAGSVLVTLCLDDSATGGSAITAATGTQRDAGAIVTANNYCLSEITGTGVSVTPSFTSSAGGASTYGVLQLVLTPAAAAGNNPSPFLSASPQDPGAPMQAAFRSSIPQLPNNTLGGKCIYILP